MIPRAAPSQVTFISTPALHGAASVAPDGLSVLYRPTLGFAGSDSFTYTVIDPSGLSSTAVVAVSVEQNGQCGGAPVCSGHGICKLGR